MIGVRNRKNQITIFDPMNKNKNNESEILDEEKCPTPKNNIETNNFSDFINISAFLLFLTVFLIFSKMTFFKKNKEIAEINVQANPHSIDRTQKNIEFEKSNEKNIVIEKKKENKAVLKSNIIIDKENILGYGANGTIVYNGLFQNREMAIKRIIAHQAEFAKQEMEIMMKLDHPNIIKFFYYEEQK